MKTRGICIFGFYFSNDKSAKLTRSYSVEHVAAGQVGGPVDQVEEAEHEREQDA